jgi:hypothetical protein
LGSTDSGKENPERTTMIRPSLVITEMVSANHKPSQAKPNQANAHLRNSVHFKSNTQKREEDCEQQKG